MPNPIGISFMPSADNQQMGGRQSGMESGGSDLAQAFKILSLHLPRVLGAGALSPRKLLEGGGSGAVPGAFNPASAIFEAMLKAMNGGQPFSPTPEPSPGRLGPAMPPESRYNPQPPAGGGGYVPPNYTPPNYTPRPNPEPIYQPPPAPHVDYENPGDRVVYNPPDVPDTAPAPSSGYTPREPRQRWV